MPFPSHSDSLPSSLSLLQNEALEDLLSFLLYAVGAAAGTLVGVAVAVEVTAEETMSTTGAVAVLVTGGCLVSAFFHVGRQSSRDEPAQYISMRAPETTVVVPNGSHYRDSQYM